MIKVANKRNFVNKYFFNREIAASKKGRVLNAGYLSR